MKKQWCAAMVFLAAFVMTSCSGNGDKSGAGSSTAAGRSSADGISQGTGSGSGFASSGAGTPLLTLIGHASLKIRTAEGTVIYVDPYYPGDYSEKADIILVSHEHSDHNKVGLCTQNSGCRVLRVKDTINGDNTYNTFEIRGVRIGPFPASNKNHPLGSTNGFILTFDGITVYDAADTSEIPQMADLAGRNIDYAFFPIDGQYNMGPEEAERCAGMAGAKHAVPFHILDADIGAFRPDNLLLIAYGETIELEP